MQHTRTISMWNEPAPRMKNVDLQRDVTDAFISFLDDLYYEGFASQLAADPERYFFELNSFIDGHFDN